MEQSQEVFLSFEEDIGCSQTIYVVPLGKKLYRLEETPIFVDLELSFGDTIEAEMQANGDLRFRRVAERSLWHHWHWVVSKNTVESALFQAFQQAIEAHGGVWERVFGGIFLIHLPPDTDFDPDAVWEQMIAQQRLEREKHAL